MSHFDISDPAQRDLGEIAEYLNDRNPAAARKQIAQFIAAFRKLADLPGMGRSQEHRRPNMRSWPVGSYVVYYRPTPDGIRVLRVFHGSRDLDSLLGGPSGYVQKVIIGAQNLPMLRGEAVSEDPSWLPGTGRPRRFTFRDDGRPGLRARTSRFAWALGGPLSGQAR